MSIKGLKKNNNKFPKYTKSIKMGLEKYVREKIMAVYI